MVMKMQVNELSFAYENGKKSLTILLLIIKHPKFYISWGPMV